MARRLPKTVLLCSLLLLASACAEAASAKGMAISPGDVKGASPALTRSVWLGMVDGGQQTTSQTGAQISDDAFREAIEQSLRRVGLFSDRPDAPLTVTATLVSLQRPRSGAEITATSVVRWAVRETRSGKLVLEDTVTAAHTASAADAVRTETRVRVAVEGAARKSITALVQKLQALEWTEPAAQPPR
jgi:hypothetical protein